MRSLGKGRRWSDDRGAAAVEFALVLIPLLLVVFGIVEFGAAYNTQISLSGAAREGARVMAIEDDSGAATTATTNAAPSVGGLDASNVGVSPGSCTSGDEVTVTVTYPYDTITPLPAFVPGVPDSITLTGVGVMRCGG